MTIRSTLVGRCGESDPLHAGARRYYAESGLLIEVDASDFLSGGRQLSIVIDWIKDRSIITRGRN